MRSDIFESFTKIALEKGLISNAEESDKASTKRDSKTKSLYNLDIDKPEDMKYDRNIIEDAHPESVIVSPSYDKLNGLVENENERQDITINIINKVPRSTFTNHKYAQKELLMTLVRVANDLDNSDKDELRVLADVCLAQISNRIKQADEELSSYKLPIALVGVASIFGLIYAHQHIFIESQKLDENLNNLETAIKDIKNSEVNFAQIGETYTSDFKKIIDDVLVRAKIFYDEYKKYSSIILAIDIPKTEAEIAKGTGIPGSKDAIAASKALEELNKKSDSMFTDLINKLSDPGYQTRQIENSGSITKMIDQTGILHGGKGALFSNKLLVLAERLKAFQNSARKTIKIFTDSKEVTKQKLEEEASALSALHPPSTSDKSTSEPSLFDSIMSGVSGIDLGKTFKSILGG